MTQGRDRGAALTTPVGGRAVAAAPRHSRVPLSDSVSHHFAAGELGKKEKKTLCRTNA